MTGFYMEYNTPDWNDLNVSQHLFYNVGILRNRLTLSFITFKNGQTYFNIFKVRPFFSIMNERVRLVFQNGNAKK